MRPRRRGLRFTLSMLLLAALAPAVGIAGLAALGERERREERAITQVSLLARSAARAYEREIDQVEGLLTGLATLPSVRSLDGAACSEVFARILPHTSLLNLGAIRPDGSVFCSAVPFSGTVQAGDRSYFQRAVATRRFAVGGVGLGRIVPKDQIGLGLPVLDDRHEVVAVLFAAIDADSVASGLEGLGLPRGGKVLLVDGEGVVLGAQPAAARQWRGQTVPWKESWDRLAVGDGGVEEAVGQDGTSRLMAFANLGAPGDPSRISAVVRIPSSFIALETWRSLSVTLVALLVSATLSLLGIWYFGQLRVARRVAALATATERLAGGDLSVRTGLVHAGDELGSLAASFDAMAERLQHDARERERLEDSLRQAQKLDALGRLAGGIAHDFNNLLTAILSYGRFLREDLPPDDPRQQDVDEILKAGERAATLTKQLLAFGRRQPVTPEILELNPLVARAERMLRRLLGGNVTLVLREGAHVPAVLADAGQLEQVVVNLVVNAKDAMPRGGTVILETGRTLRVPRGGGAPAPHATLAVIDDGVGMDEATRGHLFEPFFTTKEVGKGTGLGLATVFGIVEAAGGAIEVETVPGKGTAMRVFLPAAESATASDAAAEPRAEEAPRPSSSQGHETVLVVDDDDAVRSTIRRVLDHRGFRTLEGRNAADALAVARAEPGKIDLLVSDVRMPGESGVELAIALRAERPDLKVLLVSGHADRTGIPAEFSFLAKPFSPDGLVGQARALLDNRPA